MTLANLGGILPERTNRNRVSYRFASFFIVSSPKLHKSGLESASVSVPRPTLARLPPLSTLAFSKIISERSLVGRQPPDLRGAQTKFEIRNVSFWYGKTQALFDVSLVIPQGA